MSSVNSSIETISEKYVLNLNIKLLDNQNREISRFNKTINEEGYIVRKDNDIDIKKKQSEINRNEIFLFRNKILNNNIIKIDNFVSKKNNFQKIELVDYLDNKLWFILNPENKEEKEKTHYSLYESDIIKLGTIKFIVHEINIISDNSDPNMTINKETNDYNEINKNSEEIFYQIPEIENYKRCKFCDTYNVCLCDPKKEHILHYSCLEDKVKKELKTPKNKNENIKSYIIENFKCVHCLSQYPIRFRLGNKNSNLIYDLIPIERPMKSDYIILESFGDMNKKSIYLIILKEKIIKIGRNEKNDLILNDSSIGDEHAVIKFDKNNKKVILESVNNNYETSVLVKKNIIMNEKVITLQVGNLKFEANLKKINN